MAPRPRETPPASGILASAFNFVTREIESFVTAATGGDVQKEQPEASSSRITLDGKRRDRDKEKEKEKRREKRAKRVRKRSEVESDRVKARRRLREEGEGERTERVVKKRMQSQPVPWERERETLSEREDADDEDDVLSVRPLPKSVKMRRELQAMREDPPNLVDEAKPGSRATETQHVTADPPKLMPPPLHAVPPRPTPLTTRLATPFPTMPGSLFPRSASLMPETPAVIRSAVPRFCTPLPPPDDDEKAATEAAGDAAGANHEESTPRGRSSTKIANEEDVYSGPSPVRGSSQRSDTSGRVRSSSRRSVEEPLSEFAVRPRPSSSKGKERAYDTSGEIRVRGVEQELLQAREEHARNTHGRDNIEREEDKQRIRMLEEEVARLRAELALKTGTNASLGLMPPPPPPPPPPLLRTHVPTSSDDKGRYLASVRAKLKPTCPPVEAPINGVAYGGPRTRKSGQPTVNVPSDKMAAFLREMKTVRLRRTGGPTGSMGPPLFTPSAAGDVAGELTRSTSGSRMSDARRAAIMGDTSFDSGVAARIFIGEKRKRDAAEEVIAGPSKRRGTDFVRSDITGGSSSSAVTGSSSQSSASSSQISSSSRMSGASTNDKPLRPRTNTQLRIWPTRSTETDVTTPSLCSDNENDHSEDKPPETPSDSGRGHDAESGKPLERRPQGEPEIIDVDALETPPKPPKCPASQSPPAVETKDAFARRVPVSPLPAKTPTKPKPPARAKTKIPSKLPLPRRAPVPVVQPDEREELESDDPLLMTCRRPESRRRSPEARVADPSRPLIKRSESSSDGSRSHSRTEVPKEAKRAESWISNHARRRLTLDNELRRAGDSLWQEEEERNALPPSEPEEDLDSGELVALGTRTGKSGFLVRGGGAGMPVFMEGGANGLRGRSRSDSTAARAGGGR